MLKIGSKTHILGGRAEADRDISFTLQPWSKKLIQRGPGNYWVQFSLVRDLLIASQLDQRKVVPEEIDSNRTVARELGILNKDPGRVTE